MVPKLHKKGTSFKGAAAYLLHDKDQASTVDRVDWVEVRNLAIDDPDTAWRIMAATSMDQDRLKQQAGVKNTGRKSRAHVLHYSLAWHADEADELTRDEMMRAAHGSIRALGADDRQAMIIAHSDEQHPHVHILINRVSPENGVILSSSKEKLNLSHWAEAYEKERGQFLCEQRVLNNEARSVEMDKSKKDREFVRGDKDQARHIRDAEEVARPAINDNKPMADRVRDEQRAKDAALAQRGRDQQARHQSFWDQLTASHREAKDVIRQDTRRSIGAAAAEIRSSYAPKRRELHRNGQEQLQEFDQAEETLRGKAANLIKVVNLTRQVRSDDEQQSTIRTYYDLLSSSGARRKALERAQERQRRDLQREQDQELENRKEALRAQERAQMEENRTRFQQQRQEIIDQQDSDRADLRRAWELRNEDRRLALQELQRQSDAIPPVGEEFKQAADPDAQRDQKTDQRQVDQDPPLSTEEEERQRMLRDLQQSKERDHNRDRDR